jgi:hypothetical protein
VIEELAARNPAQTLQGNQPHALEAYAIIFKKVHGKAMKNGKCG